MLVSQHWQYGTFGFTLLSTYGSLFCSTYYERSLGQSKGNWGGRCVWLDVWPRNSFLIQPNGEMMRTLTDKTVTNQSHCESQRTVRDISGQSSYALGWGEDLSLHIHTQPRSLSDHSGMLFALWKSSIPSYHCIAVPPALSLWGVCHPLVTLRPACGGQTEGHRQRW